MTMTQSNYNNENEEDERMYGRVRLYTDFMYR